MRVLITCGATWVPIDDVRVISNISTGEMGHLIALVFRQKKAQVTLIEGPVTHALNDKKVRIIKYRFFDELAAALNKELLKQYDVVIHAAAVSDFKVPGKAKGKIPSDQALTLNLSATPKLIKKIKHLAPHVFLVGFKLEPDLRSKNIFEKIKPLFNTAGCDLVVANSLKHGYQGFIVNANGDILRKVDSKQKMAKTLVGLCKDL